jgi:outer membrane protein
MHIKALITLFILIFFLQAHSQSKITLQDAINYTLQNNLQLKQSLVTEMSNKLDILQAKQNLYPNLNVGLATNLNFGRSLDPTTNIYLTQNSVSATENMASNVTVFQGFAKINQIKQNKLILESNKSSTQKLRNDLTLQVVATYLSILSNEDQLAAAKSQYDLGVEQLDVANKNFSVGKKMLADLSLAKYQIAKSEVDLTTIQGQINSSRITLLQLMNMNLDAKPVLEKPIDNYYNTQSKSVKEIYDYAIKNLPEIKLAQYAKQAAIKGVKIAEGGYFPTLTLSGVVASNYLRELQNQPESILFSVPSASFSSQFHANLYEYISLNLNIPVFNNLSTKIAVRKAKLSLESAEISESIANNTLYGVISQAYDDLQGANKNLTSSQKSYESASESFHVIQKRFLNGLSNSIDLNQAQNDMNQAQFKLIYAKYDLIFKMKVIDFYLGKPLSF